MSLNPHLKSASITEVVHGLFWAVFMLLACGCGNLYRALADDLTLEPTTLEGPPIRLDGLWYTIGVDDRYYAFAFLYENGLLQYIGGRYDQTDFEVELGEMLETDEHKDYARNNRLSTGVFNIHGSTIRLEKWYPSSGGPTKAYIKQGEVVNDTLFVIREFYRTKNGKKKKRVELDETYYFKAFSAKPDSFNVYAPK